MVSSPWERSWQELSWALTKWSWVQGKRPASIEWEVKLRKQHPTIYHAIYEHGFGDQVGLVSDPNAAAYSITLSLNLSKPHLYDLINNNCLRKPGESQAAEPGGLPSMVSHRVRHDWSDLGAAESC